MAPNLDEDFWEDLLTLIDEGKVIPVIGAGVVTRSDDQRLFYPWLAQRLAERLGIPLETQTTPSRYGHPPVSLGALPWSCRSGCEFEAAMDGSLGENGCLAAPSAAHFHL
jgi:hypothetical protein